MPPGPVQLLMRIAQPQQKFRLPGMPLLVARLHEAVGVQTLEDAPDVPLRPSHLTFESFSILSHDGSLYHTPRLVTPRSTVSGRAVRPDVRVSTSAEVYWRSAGASC